MKKTLAYATVAVILGITIMLAPLLIITFPATGSAAQRGENTYGAPQSIPRSLSPATTQAEAKQSESSAGIVPNYPVNILTIALMILTSLAVAFSAYFYVRHHRLLKNGNMPLKP